MDKLDDTAAQIEELELEELLMVAGATGQIGSGGRSEDPPADPT